MCCILCEEPVRSITFGLAAVGVVTIVNGVRKLLARSETAERVEQALVDAPEVAAGDVAP